MSRAPKERPRPPAPNFDMHMAALVVILEDEAEGVTKEDSRKPREALGRSD
jgi:hypothetical protein